MAQRFRGIAFLNAATTASAGEGNRVRTDYRFDDGGIQRTLFGSLTGGAEVNVYVITSARGGPDHDDPNHQGVSITHLEVTISAGSSSFNTQTNTFAEVLNGPFKFIEVRKDGGAGTATVIGHL